MEEWNANQSGQSDPSSQTGGPAVPESHDPYASQIPAPQASGNQPSEGLAIASLVLGCLGIMGCCLPCFGQVFPVVGLVLGIVAYNQNKNGLGKSAVIVNIVALSLAVVLILIQVILNVAGIVIPTILNP